MVAFAASMAASACSMLLFRLTRARSRARPSWTRRRPGPPAGWPGRCRSPLRDRSLIGQWLQASHVGVRLVQKREGHVQIGLGGVDGRLLLREGQVGLGLGQLRPPLLELGLELSLIQGEEHLVLLDHGAFREVLLLQEGLDAGADLDRVLGVGARHELAANRHRPLHNLGDDDGGRGRRGGGLLVGGALALSAASEHARHQGKSHHAYPTDE